MIVYSQLNLAFLSSVDENNRGQRARQALLNLSATNLRKDKLTSFHYNYSLPNLKRPFTFTTVTILVASAMDS